MLGTGGQSSDFDDEAVSQVVPVRSLSLSPVNLGGGNGAELSEPETELEEDLESKPYQVRRITKPDHRGNIVMA